ncbi:tapasin-related protein [Salarias fasciatus]|uniref:Ig-like domain-containing protein n=1 Tax=Salarias fasciatus TaxID=181472 RepID=A0A672G3M7_SALFA|nr:tapasin-related protein [Salarias fasciatus]
MSIRVILLGFFLTSVSADGITDLVLSCALVDEGGGHGGMGGGSMFSRTPVTLVLRDVAVGPDESLELLTPFVAPSVPDPDLIIFEAQASSPEIPNAEALLHADCNDQEVMCEISLYSSQELRDSSDSAYFMVSINVEGVESSATLILQTLAVEKDQATLVQNRLDLPLSSSGTLLTKVIFLVFSDTKSVSAPVKAEIVLSCGFKQQDAPLAQEVSVEWRLQHRGKGQKVLDMKTQLDDVEGNTEIHAVRRDSSIDVAQVANEGNVSLTLDKLKVSDEGTYICTVSLGPFHCQQTVQLQIQQPPQVSLSKDKLVVKSAQTLSCHSNKYYPLDSQMEWFFLSPSDTEPQPFAERASLSSHRQHFDGTYSLSSHITVPPTISPGTKITCRVTHAALDSPLHVHVMVESPEPESYWWIFGFLFITILFFYQVMR